MAKPILDNPLKPNTVNEIKVINVAFDSQTSHYAVVEQFVSGLVKAKYAKRKEVCDALKEYFY